MNFMIVDSNGNALDAFESYSAARNELRAMAFEDPRAARDLALLTFNDNGLAVGEAVVAADVAPEVLGEISIISLGWHEVTAHTFSAWTEPGSSDPLPANEAAASAA
jgi:hypothetical protein